MGNNPVGKKVNAPKVNTWVNTFLRKYLGIYLFT